LTSGNMPTYGAHMSSHSGSGDVALDLFLAVFLAVLGSLFRASRVIMRGSWS
jgi:hypothetical protein